MTEELEHRVARLEEEVYQIKGSMGAYEGKILSLLPVKAFGVPIIFWSMVIVTIFGIMVFLLSDPSDAISEFLQWLASMQVLGGGVGE